MVKKFKQRFYIKELRIWICKSICKNTDPDKYKYSGYRIGFDSRSEFSFTDLTMGKNVIIFGADMSSSVHVDNKGKDILILDEGPTQGYHINSRR